MKENEKQIMLPSEIQMLIGRIIPDTKYFDSRFDNLQVQVNEVRRNQEYSREQMRDLKLDMDNKFGDVNKRFDEFRQDMLERFNESRRDMLERFEQVDKRFDESRRDMLERFEQVDKRFIQVDKRFENIDKRFENIDKRFENIDKRFENVDKRFENVDKRFDQVIASIERIGDKLDKRDERQRRFTLRMFNIAIGISILGALGAFLKSFGII